MIAAFLIAAVATLYGLITDNETVTPIASIALIVTALLAGVRGISASIPED